MDYGDYCWGLYRDYYWDPFPHSLLSTREISGGWPELGCSGTQGCGGWAERHWHWIWSVARMN